VQAHPLLSYFGLAYLISWTLWLPAYCPPLKSLALPFQHALGSFGPLLAGLLLSWRLQGKAGLTELWKRMTRWRVGAGWYVLVLLGPLLLAIAALGLEAALNKHPLQLTGLGLSPEFPGLGRVGFLLFTVLVYGYGEEVGWRGFALPRLERSYGPRWSVLLLALGWAGWHLPLFLYRPGMMQMGIGGAIGWLCSILTGTALMSWLYRHTRGSLLIAALLHATLDLAFTGQTATVLATNVVGAVITTLGIMAFWRLRPLPAQASF